jgi:hypothetical protein
MSDSIVRPRRLLWGALGVLLLGCPLAEAQDGADPMPATPMLPATTQATDHPELAKPEAAPPLNPSVVPPRPPPLIELGDKFFGTGALQRGFTLPTGAVWTPNFTVFGTYRSAVQAFHDPLTESGPLAADFKDKTRSEWANRLDVFGNLQLSGTERLLVGLRPLDDATFAKPAQAKYFGYQFSPDTTDGWVYKFKAEPTTLFFEGDIGQIFPRLDPMGTSPWDIGFSVGRQPLLYQDGLLLDDDIDAVGITRNTILPRGASNAQITALYGWGQINRGDGINHDDHLLLGLVFNADFRPTTWNLDLFYVGGDSAVSGGAYAGLSATQRIGVLNTTFRLLGSKALGRPSGGPASEVSQFGNGSSAVGNGALLFSEMSYTVPYRNDLVYLDTYWGIDRFTSAARGPDRGGALGRVGILFAEQPIGRFGSALSSDPERSAGFALGYQAFLDPDRRRQLILELGGRIGTANPSAGALATGAQYQQAFGQHTVLEVGGFVALNESEGLGYGVRVEVRYEF